MNASDIALSAGAYFGLKDLVPKILGPTCDYLGDGLRGVTQKGVENIKRIFLVAEKRLGNRINSPGCVSPRVLKVILNEGYFTEDQVAAEYLGGILASSRTNEHRDDRGAYFAALVARLSSYQIRSHYVIYQCFKHVFDGKRLPFNHMELREKAAICIPLKNYAQAMDCEPHEGLTPYLDHATIGLIKESLINTYFAHGESSLFRLLPPSGLEQAQFLGLLTAPTCLGLELFLWSHGEGRQPVHQFFFSGNQFSIHSEIKLDLQGVEKAPIAREWGPESEPAGI
jgi:hypothetical protein